jgi:hypothetical protein
MLARNPTHRPRRRVQEDQVVATLLEQLLARADVSLGLKLRKYRQAAAGDVKFFLRMERCPVRYPASLLSHLRHAKRALCHRGSGVAQTRQLLSDCSAATVLRTTSTAMQKWRIVILRFGTARQIMVLE